MTTNEQFLLRIGIDQSQITPELESYVDKFRGATQKVEKSFVQAGSASRAFRKTLMDLNQSIPGLGSAIQFMISPIVGVLTSATVAWQFLNKQVDDFNQYLDRMAENTDKPLWNMRDALESAHKSMAQLNQDFAKWLSNLDDQQHKTDMARQNEIEDLKSSYKIKSEQLDIEKARAMAGKDSAERAEIEFEFAKKSNALALEQARSVNAKLSAQKSDADKWLSDQMGKLNVMHGDSSVPKRLEEIERLKTAIEGRKMLGGDLGDKLRAAVGRENFWDESKKIISGAAVLTGGTIGGIASSKMFDWFRGFMGDNPQSPQLMKSAAQNKEQDAKEQSRLDDLLEAQKKYDDEIAHQQTVVEKAKTAEENLGQQREQSARLVRELTARGVIPQQGSNQLLDQSRATVEQLASAQGWQTWNNGVQFRRFFGPSPFAREAQEILRLRAEASQANLMGQTDLRDRDNARISALLKDLGGKGVLKTEEYLAEIMNDMKVVAGCTDGGSMNVNPSNGQ